MQSTEIGVQNTLFPEVEPVTVFEQPLNERIRNCLRLEHLFAAIHNGLSGNTEWHARSAIVAMLEISDLMTRTDIKGELIKELERQLTKIAGLRDNPDVDLLMLEDILGAIEPLISRLKASDCQPGSTIRSDELVNQVKQRAAIPGGTCNFDLPAFHHWLSKPLIERNSQIERWLSDLMIVNDAVEQILKILRESSTPQRVTVEDGLFQRQLDPNAQYQLVRVLLSDALGVFPEISGGKHRFVVRFFRQPDTTGRPVQARDTLSIEIQCCGL